MICLEHRQHIVEIVKESVDAGARVNQACQTVNINAATYRRWQKNGTVIEDGRANAARPTPHNKFSIQQRDTVLATCHSPQFQSAPPSQIVPTLADEGTYIGSEATFYRVLREAHQQHERGRARVRSHRAKPDEYNATGPNQCWSWDVTWLKSPVAGIFYYLYMIIDVFSRKIVGWEVYETECGELASELVTRAFVSEGYPHSLDILHADNGAIQKSSTLRVTLERLKVEPTYNRPRVSNDNPYSESLFRTTKYRPDYPSAGFSDLGSARQWVLDFVNWYNLEHKHSGIKFVTPNQRHNGEDRAILAHRDEVYRQARNDNPSRWTGHTRDWSWQANVKLNPDKPPIKVDTGNSQTVPESG